MARVDFETSCIMRFFELKPFLRESERIIIRRIEEVVEWKRNF